MPMLKSYLCPASMDLLEPTPQRAPWHSSAPLFQTIRVRSMYEEPYRITALVAHRWTLLRDGLVKILQYSWPDWTVVGADHYRHVAVIAAQMPVSLSVLDISLHGLDLAQGIALLKGVNPSHCVIVLGDADDRAGGLACLDAGASAYIEASATSLQFVTCVQTVLVGGVFLPRTLQFAEQRTPYPHNHPSVRFTARQQDVLRLLSEGCSTKSIARRLDLSIGTVKVHLASIFRTLSVHSRAEAVIKARDLCRGKDMFLKNLS